MKLAEVIAQKTVAMTVADVAGVLQISERLVYQMAADNKIPSFKVRGSIRFDPHVLSEWVTQMMENPDPPVKTIVPLLCQTRLNEAEQVCGQAFQLVAQLTGVLPDAHKWLDNLAEGRLVHQDLLPVTLDLEKRNVAE